MALYVAALDREGLVPASVDVALAAIARMHQAHALASPCASPSVAAVRVGLRRTRGTAPRQAAPLRIDDLRTAVDAIGSDLLGLCDRALLRRTSFGLLLAIAKKRANLVTSLGPHGAPGRVAPLAWRTRSKPWTA
jgi:hypothetical protein